MFPKWTVYSIAAAAFFGAWGVVSKVSSDAITPELSQVLFPLGLLPAVLLAAGRCRRPVAGDWRRGVAYGFITGILGGAGNLAFFSALNDGRASVVVPLTGVYPVVTVLLAASLLREKLRAVQWIGVIVATVSVTLLSGEASAISDPGKWWREFEPSTWMTFSIVALVFWGLTGVTQKLSSNHVPAEISFLAFAAAFVPISILMLAVTDVSWPAGGNAWLWAILSGALNGFGSLISFAAYRAGGRASIVTPLIALYPVVTVILAVALLCERIGPVEIAGIGVAVLAAVMLGIEKQPEGPSAGAIANSPTRQKTFRVPRSGG